MLQAIESFSNMGKLPGGWNAEWLSWKEIILCDMAAGWFGETRGERRRYT